MGSYGIGITRTVSAIIEQNHDEKGMIWPLIAAPYHVIITIMKPEDEAQNALAEKLYADLQEAGVEVLLDDRKERPGVKFNDRDLIGIPLRLTVGRKAAEGIVEFSTRREMENKDIAAEEAFRTIVDAVKAIQ